MSSTNASAVPQLTSLAPSSCTQTSTTLSTTTTLTTATTTSIAAAVTATTTTTITSAPITTATPTININVSATNVPFSVATAAVGGGTSGVGAGATQTITPSSVTAILTPQLPITAITPTAIALQQQTQHLLSIDKSDDANNLSLASGISEGQRSLSGAPSASSSPILSPPGKIFGRNANGTLIATSRPSNEAEVQLYRLLQRASLLAYYDTLLEMGGDDVQQLYEAGEEEFLEIMALVGMASKPLHVRRLQKALHEWASNPSLFQGPILSNPTSLCDTPTKPTVPFNPDPSPSSHTRPKYPTYNPTPTFNPTPLTQTSSSAQLLSQICTAAAVSGVPPTAILQTQGTTLPNLPTTSQMPCNINLPTISQTTAAIGVLGAISGSGVVGVSGVGCGSVGGIIGGACGGNTTTTTSQTTTTHQVSSSSPQLTPILTELQIARITQGAEKIARQIPQREPRAQTSKKRTSRELEQVIAMSENDPRRMDEIRKYSAIYGRFDCKRRHDKPLTLHEVCVNEAAAQLCRMVPALLKRRDELFPLARQIVKDAGFGHSASIARYGSLLQQMQAQSSSDSAISGQIKRQRLSSTETPLATTDLTRETSDDSRYNLFAMYQKFAKPPFDLTDITKFTLAKADYDDNDNDSRFSFSNSSSPSMPHNGRDSERERELQAENMKIISDEALSSSQNCSNHSPIHLNRNGNSPNNNHHQHHHNNHNAKILNRFTASETMELSCSSTLTAAAVAANSGVVQVISAAGEQIIAVANPALIMSPTLNEALSMKREVDATDN